MWKSIRLNIVLSSHIIYSIVSMENIVLLHILIMSWRQELFIRWLRIPISICSTSRQNGVPLTKSITKPNVFMPTIGKIFVANHISSPPIIPMKCVLIGKEGHLLVNMKMGVWDRLLVERHMDGKSRCFIHWFIKLCLALIHYVKKLILNAHFIIVMTNEES